MSNTSLLCKNGDTVKRTLPVVAKVENLVRKSDFSEVNLITLGLHHEGASTVYALAGYMEMGCCRGHYMSVTESAHYSGRLSITQE